MEISSDKKFLINSISYTDDDRQVGKVKYLQKQTTYYVKILSYEIAFDLLVTSPPADEGSQSSPAKLNVGDTHSFTTNGNQSHYTININSSGWYSVKAINISSIDSLVLGLNTNDFNDTNNTSIGETYASRYIADNQPIIVFLDSGTYYLKAINYNDNGSYDLRIMPATYRVVKSDQLIVNEPLSISSSYKYISFDISSSGNYNILLLKMQPNSESIVSDYVINFYLYANPEYYIDVEGSSYYYRDYEYINTLHSYSTYSGYSKYVSTNLNLEVGTYYFRISNWSNANFDLLVSKTR